MPIRSRARIDQREQKRSDENQREATRDSLRRPIVGGRAAIATDRPAAIAATSLSTTVARGRQAKGRANRATKRHWRPDWRPLGLLGRHSLGLAAVQLDTELELDRLRNFKLRREVAVQWQCIGSCSCSAGVLRAWDCP